MAKKPKNPSDYPVGYAKPPQKSRFKKGQSGNPKGRSQGAPNLATALDRALKEKVVVNDGGQRRVISKLEAMVTNMVNKAAVGEHRARQQLLQVIRVLDGDPAEASSDAELVQEDEEIMKRIAERLKRTLQEKSDDNPKSK